MYLQIDKEINHINRTILTNNFNFLNLENDHEIRRFSEKFMTL